MKNRKILLFVLILSIGILFFSGCNPDINNNNNNNDANTPQEESTLPEEQEVQYHFLKGAWVPTVYALNFPSAYTTDSAKLKADINIIVATAKDAGLNTLFFQVRPSCDAFYKSSIFPWSKYLSGTQGTAPKNNFDPLKYIIEKCHENDIELHAWINPLRVTANSNDNLISSHPLYKDTNLTFKVNDKIYLNPGIPEAIEFVVDGIREIVLNYDVDGIHYDDYFYPEGEIPDTDTFAEYGVDFGSIRNWRVDNINNLIKNTYVAIKEINENISFGVSPPGIWANYSSNILGSQTSGFEAFYRIYADSRGWVKNGWVDYIAPQIYWYVGQLGSDFSTLIKWWKDVCKDTGVALYVGIAGYKSGDTAQNSKWNDGQEVSRQLAMADMYADGIIIYSFSDVQKPEVNSALLKF